MKSKYIRQVRKIGDSISVTIPSSFEIFKAGEEVWIELKDDKLIISKVKE